MKIFNEKIKTIVISSLGAFLCIYAIAYLNLVDETNAWLIPPFGASLVLVMAVHDSPLASPRNVFFGHVLSASSGVMIYYFFWRCPNCYRAWIKFCYHFYDTNKHCSSSSRRKSYNCYFRSKVI